MEFSIIISFLSFLIVLTPIVFIHELGHFFAARIFNVNVEIARFYNVYGPRERVDDIHSNVIGIWRSKIKKGYYNQKNMPLILVKFNYIGINIY